VAAVAVRKPRFHEHSFGNARHRRVPSLLDGPSGGRDSGAVRAATRAQGRRDVSMMVKFAGRGAHRLRTLVVAGCLLALACPAPAGQEHLVPMSDGVRLVTDVFLPEEGGPSWPVVLERSPYPRPQNDQGWNRLGIAYVVQSVRGRFGSEGTFRPFADEGWGEHT